VTNLATLVFFFGAIYIIYIKDYLHINRR